MGREKCIYTPQGCIYFYLFSNEYDIIHIGEQSMKHGTSSFFSNICHCNLRQKADGVQDIV